LRLAKHGIAIWVKRLDLVLIRVRDCDALEEDIRRNARGFAHAVIIRTERDFVTARRTIARAAALAGPHIDQNLAHQRLHQSVLRCIGMRSAFKKKTLRKGGSEISKWL